MLTTVSKNMFSKMLKHNFFLQKFILKLNSFTAKVWTANYNKSPQMTLKVFFFTAEHPDSWISIT